MEGLHIDFERIAGWMKLESVKEFSQLVDRYEKFGVQVDQVIGCLKSGVEKGLTNHEISMVRPRNKKKKNAKCNNVQKSTFSLPQRGVTATIKKHLPPNTPKDTSFWSPFEEALASKKLSTLENEGLLKRAESAILDVIQPGFQRLLTFLEDVYSKHTRKEIGATSLPNGARFYEQCVRFHTSTSLTAKEIHDMGLREVERIEGEMKKVGGKKPIKMEIKN